MATTERVIDINDIGPIRNLRIPLPGDGGVIVLKGKNGLGKSTAIDAVESAIKGSGALTVRRGSSRGTVDACGVTIRVGRNTRRAGELEVETLEGKLSVSELVDPHMKDDAAADRVRIRALLHVLQYDGSAAGPKFRELLSKNDFDKLVKTESLTTTDPVEMASKIKRDLEEAARQLEVEAEGLSGRAKGLEDAAHGIAEPDGSESELAAKLSQLTLDLERAQEHNRQVAAALTARDTAHNAVAVWERDSAGKPSVVTAQGDVAVYENEQALAAEAMTAARLAFQQAEARHAQLFETVAAKMAILAEAETREKAVAEWREKAAVEIANAHPLELLERLEADKTAAERGIADGGVRRKAAEDRKYGGELRGEASEKNGRALKLRDAAKATDDVLTDLVSECGVALTINQGRIVFNDGSQERLFHELSLGEKYRIGLDIAIQAANRLVESSPASDSPGVLLTIPQEAWESLDPYNRQSIAQQASDGGVWIVTAMATGHKSLSATTYTGAEPLELDEPDHHSSLPPMNETPPVFGAPTSVTVDEGSVPEMIEVSDEDLTQYG